MQSLCDTCSDPWVKRFIILISFPIIISRLGEWYNDQVQLCLIYCDPQAVVCYACYIHRVQAGVANCTDSQFVVSLCLCASPLVTLQSDLRSLLNNRPMTCSI